MNDTYNTKGNEVAETDKEKTQRRVYVLPSELVDRINQFQKEMGLPSEVEAARRLLDEALKHRDDAIAIAKRFRARLAETKMFSDIARDVLVGHPRVASISFHNNWIEFRTKDDEDVRLYADGSGSIGEGYGSTKFDRFDDEIPF